MDSLSATATQDPEGFLGHPVNAFKLMKRLNTEWGDLESLVLSDTTDGMKEAPPLSSRPPGAGGGLSALIWWLFLSSRVYLQPDHSEAALPHR